MNRVSTWLHGFFQMPVICRRLWFSGCFSSFAVYAVDTHTSPNQSLSSISTPSNAIVSPCLNYTPLSSLRRSIACLYAFIWLVLYASRQEHHSRPNFYNGDKKWLRTLSSGCSNFLGKGPPLRFPFLPCPTPALDAPFNDRVGHGLPYPQPTLKRGPVVLPRKFPGFLHCWRRVLKKCTN